VNEDRLIEFARSEDSSNYYGVTGEWLEHCKRLRKLILAGDLANFLRWDVIIDTMFVAFGVYVEKELELMGNMQLFGKDRWRDILKEDEFGNPHMADGNLKTSANLVHTAFHAAYFRSLTGLNPKDLSTIFEIGGGYGCMCKVMHRFGFRGKYILYDLPIFLELQRFYLENVGIDTGSIEFVPSPRIPIVEPGALCVATWSLSEMPIMERERLFPAIVMCDAFLFGYQDVFGDIDNVEYFSHLRKALHEAEWSDSETSWNERNHYSIGVT
jgi:hypothetical protein